jgi:prepilin-type N-terminal cleavage/methylation domain-containing protein
MQLSKLTQRGDTIVEVLIAIAVIGAVLGGAYSLVNANVKSNQLAQERSVAVKVAESQLEQLRAYAESSDVSAIAVNSNFCFRTDGSKVNFTSYTGALPSTDGNYPNACKFDGADGLQTKRYMTGIRVLSANTFTVYVSWDDPTGNRAQSSIAYKVY